MLKQIANAITGCRILCSFLLLVFDTFTTDFYITYILCGFSDMIIDEFLAGSITDIK